MKQPRPRRHDAAHTKSGRQRFQADPPPGDGYYKWRVKITEHPPYEKWASLIGECAHSLRSALDHTAYAIINPDPANLVNEKCAFPIVDEPGKWSSAEGRDLKGLVDPKVRAEIEGLQPYNRLKQDDPLWLVHMLDVADKHRRLNLISATLDGTFWRATRGTLTPLSGGQGPFIDGAVVGEFSLFPDPPDTEMQMETHFAFGIAIGKGEPGEGQGAIPLLEWLRSYVGGVVALFDRYLV